MVEADISELSSALKRLGLNEILYKEKARESLLSMPVKSVDDPRLREREMLNQLLLSNPMAVDVTTVSNQPH